MENRREHKRFKIKCSTRIEAMPKDSEEKTRILRLDTHNICSGGAYFHTLTPLQEGTPVKIDIVVESKNLRYPIDRRLLVYVEGIVSRSEPKGMAIRFMAEPEIMRQSG